MNDQVLDILKACLIALLYLFLARVVWVVNRELRGTPIPSAVPPPPPAAPKATIRDSRRARGWRLEIREPAAFRDQIFAVDTEVTVGRGGGCAIAVPDDTYASTLHARIFPRDDTLWIEDLGSTNGTTVNGALISEPTRLRKGDRIGIGGTALEVGR